jgi:hypothetical protein
MTHRSILSGITLAAVVLAGAGFGGQSATAAEPTPEPTPSAQVTAEPSPTATPSATPTPTPTGTTGPEVDVVTINGTGCPLNSGAVEVSEERNRLVVEYSDFMAASGPGLTAGNARRNCQMMLDITAPDGYTFAVSSLRMEGTADLPDGTTAVVKTNSYFQGSTASLSLQEKITGPSRDDWAFTLDVPLVSRVYKPCGEDNRLLAVNNQVQLNGVTTGTTVASVTVERFSALELVFGRC